MKRNASMPTVPSEAALILTVGVPLARDAKNRAGDRALSALRNLGFECGPTSDAALVALVRQNLEVEMLDHPIGVKRVRREQIIGLLEELEREED